MTEGPKIFKNRQNGLRTGRPKCRLTGHFDPKISELAKIRSNVHFDDFPKSPNSRFQNGHGRVGCDPKSARSPFLHWRGNKTAVFDILYCACDSKVQNDQKWTFWRGPYCRITKSISGPSRSSSEAWICRNTSKNTGIYRMSLQGTNEAVRGINEFFLSREIISLRREFWIERIFPRSHRTLLLSITDTGL